MAPAPVLDIFDGLWPCYSCCRKFWVGPPSFPTLANTPKASSALANPQANRFPWTVHLVLIVVTFSAKYHHGLPYSSFLFHI